MALSLSVLMAGAWMVQQHNGNSGWVDTIWTFAVGLVGVGGALWPVAGAAPHARQWLVAVLVAIWSVRLGLRGAHRRDHRRPALRRLARQWGIDSPRRMFVFLQNQGFGSIPLVFAIFVAARLPAIRRFIRGRKGMALERHALPAHRARLARQFRFPPRRDRRHSLRRLRQRHEPLDAALALVLLAMSGLFGYADGIEWGVSHFRMKAGLDCGVLSQQAAMEPDSRSGDSAKAVCDQSYS
jgi:hypothetical protein